MQATQNDEAGKETRRLWVRAVQKLEVAENDERWVIKDLEVETTGSGHRTRLHFEDVKVVR
jgi:predicted aldo/keto reductase-like oxidoreductase